MKKTITLLTALLLIGCVKIPKEEDVVISVEQKSDKSFEVRTNTYMIITNINYKVGDTLKINKNGNR